MLKKFGVVAAAAAGLIMLGGTAALATPGDDGGKGDYHDHYGKVWYPGSSTNIEKEQFGLINTGDVDILDEVTVPICLNDINIGLLAVLDILSPSGIADSCDAAVASDNGDGH
ncbi:hypothetical protein [Kibdelosporangium persicum]|nr:hypothetical protein [Kibdelosporangium persicum]